MNAFACWLENQNDRLTIAWIIVKHNEKALLGCHPFNEAKVNSDRIVNKTAHRIYMIYIRIVLANYCKSECKQYKTPFCRKHMAWVD